jgi:hypothetical protein
MQGVEAVDRLLAGAAEPTFGGVMGVEPGPVPVRA